jgi:hypothetical protein
MKVKVELLMLSPVKMKADGDFAPSLFHHRLKPNIHATSSLKLTTQKKIKLENKNKNKIKNEVINVP